MKGNLTSGAQSVSDRVDNATKEMQQVPVDTPKPTVNTNDSSIEEPSSIEDISVPEPDFFGGSNDDKQQTSAVNEDNVSDVSSELTKTIRKIKANGKEHEIDFSDLDKLEQLVKLGLGARKAFADKDKLKKETEKALGEIEQLRQYKEAFDKLESIKDNPEELYYRITGGSDLKDYVKKELEKQKFLENASEDEIRQWELQQRLVALEKEKELEKKQREAAAQLAEQTSNEANKKLLKSKLDSEFTKVSFSDLEDKVEAQELNELLYTRAMKSIQKKVQAFTEKHGREPADISQTFIRKEFESARKFLDKLSSKKTEAAVQEIDKERSESAKKNAQIASTKNYGQPFSDDELRKYAARPTQLFKELFRK